MTDRMVRLGDILDDSCLRAVMKEMQHGTDCIHDRLVKALEPYKEVLLGKGVDHKYLAYAIEAGMVAQPKKACTSPGNAPVTTSLSGKPAPE